MGNFVWTWFGDAGNQSRLAAMAAFVAIVTTGCGAIWFVGSWLRRSAPEPEQPTRTKLDAASFLELQQHLKAELEAELQTAHADEQDRLRARIAELESRISNPETALKAAQTRIADLETLLERSGNDIGGDRINEARAVLERGDFSIADEIFAEIEVRREMDVQEAARAAFGRGEIAEEQVRWADAAKHYSRAAQLNPKYETLIKAGMFLFLAGQHSDAIRHEERLVELAKTVFGEEHEKTATALNNLAESYRATGRYDESEPLYRAALEIDRKTLGEAHPSYATRLNNLASLLRATGRYDEAEPLHREALEIHRKTLGEAHPSYAIDLNNLAGLLRATGRYGEAEPLYHEALEIHRKTLGETHPDYAIDLNNLANLLLTTGRYGEVEPLCREALAVIEAALGAEHPNTQRARENLETFLASRPD